jgi:predicted DNA-binding ribbon-helix-helix protein
MDRYEPVSRSLRIEGYSTSVRLERVFWDVLDGIAREQGVTTGSLVAAIYREVLASSRPLHNFSSVLRVICLCHVERNGAPGEPLRDTRAGRGRDSGEFLRPGWRVPAPR